MKPWLLPVSRPKGVNLDDYAEVSPGKEPKAISLERARAFTKNWAPISGSLFSSPGNPSFAPPGEIEDCFGSAAIVLYHRRVRKSMLIIIAFVAFCLILSGIAALTEKPPGLSISMAIVGILLLLQIVADETLFKAEPATLFERTRFFFWLRSSSIFKRNIIGCCIMAGCVACIQAAALTMLQIDDNTPPPWEFSFPEFLESNPWSIVLFQFFHANPIHFLSNLAIWLIVEPMILTMFGRTHLLPCYLVGIISGAFQCAITPDAGIVGASGFIFATLGYATGNKAPFPPGLRAQIALFSIISGALSTLLVDRSATYAHLSAFLLGLIISHLVGNSKSLQSTD